MFEWKPYAYNRWIRKSQLMMESIDLFLNIQYGSKTNSPS